MLAVLTGADVKADRLGGLVPPMPEDMGGPKGFRTIRAILEADKVRAVGDRVAFVVAETPSQARDAAELIEIDYEPLPAVISAEDAVKPGAPLVWDGAPGNVAFTLMMGSKDATDAAFAAAKHVVTLKLNNSRITANSIEPRAAIGQYHPDSDSYTLYSTSQNPHGTRSTVAGQVLHIARDQAAGDFARCRRRLRHEARRLSGGRAGRLGLATGRRPAGQMGRDALGIAAWRFPRPRPDRRPASSRLTTHGKILGLRVNALHAMGSHVVRRRHGGAAVRDAAVAGRLPHPRGSCRRPRGAHQHHSNCALSRRWPPGGDLLDRTTARPRRAQSLSSIRSSLRRRNFIPPDAMPHKVQTGITYDSGDFAHVLDECLKLADWSGFANAPPN